MVKSHIMMERSYILTPIPISTPEH